MSLTVTQRPSQTISSERSAWNAVGNPILYKMTRKDFAIASINNSGGFAQVVISGNVTASILAGDSIYFTTDAGVYNTTGTVTTSTYSAPNTLVTTSVAYISSSTGYLNDDTLRPLYGVDIYVYNDEDNDEDDSLINTEAFRYTPNSAGLLSMDISAILRAEMSADNDSDLTGTTKLFTDENVFVNFYIKYREVWTASAESLSSDSTYVHSAIFGAMQIPSTYGGNIYDYLILSDMKIADVTISTASVLTSNGSPVTIVAAPGAGYVIIPTAFFVYLDYAGVAYATNTTFRFEINGVAVSATNTTVLPGVADRFTMIESAYPDTTTDLLNKALVFETQTGNPTAGTSNIRVVCLYTIKSLA